MFKIILLLVFCFISACNTLDQEKKLINVSQYPFPNWISDNKVQKKEAGFRIIIQKNYVFNLPLGLRQIQENSAISIQQLLIDQKNKFFCMQKIDKNKCFEKINHKIKNITLSKVTNNEIYWENIESLLFKSVRHYYTIWLKVDVAFDET